MAQEKAYESKLKTLPKKPGVYLFKDSAGRVVYVGKAASLRTRVSSYFHSRALDAKTQALVAAVRDLDYIETDSEVEALLLEARLIKRYSPRYNSELKDDKSYPVIAISREPFPRVTVTRDRTRDSEYIGPFASASDLRHSMPVLQRIFRFRTCGFVIDPDARRRRRPCLLHYIDRCSAPCAGRVSRAEYAEQLRHLKVFLRRGKKKLVVALNKRMMETARDLDFETAAVMRDELSALERLNALPRAAQIEAELIHPDKKEGLRLLKKTLKLKRTPRLIDGIDAAQISGKEAVGSAVVFADGEPHNSSYRHYRIRDARTLDDPGMIAEVVLRRYGRKARENGTMPHVLLVDGGETQLRAAVNAVENAGAAGKVGAVISLAKREERVFVANGESILMERTSPALKILQHVRDEAHRFAQRYHHILRRKKVLGK
jgi:excinuclease ABC subunit C